MKMKLLIAMLLATGASVAIAQPAPPSPPTASGSGTCADPFVPAESLTVYTGSTCGGDIGIDLAGTVLGHPSVVYQFVYSDVDAGTEPDQIAIAEATLGVVIAASCTSPVLASGGAGAPPLNLDAPNPGPLTDGQTYLAIVTTDPGLPVTDPPTCSDYTMTIDTLPVELKSMDVE